MLLIFQIEQNTIILSQSRKQWSIQPNNKHEFYIFISEKNVDSSIDIFSWFQWKSQIWKATQIELLLQIILYVE